MKLNTALWTAWLGTDDLSTLVNGGFIYAYDGPVPTDVDAAVDPTCNKMARFSLNNTGTGLTMDTAADGAVSKPSAAIWSGSALRAGTPTFCRWCMGAEDGSGAVPEGAYRMQFTASDDAEGSTGELKFAEAPFVAAKLVTLDTLTISKP